MGGGGKGAGARARARISLCACVYPTAEILITAVSRYQWLPWDNLGEFAAESEMELSTCWGRYELVFWLRTRMVLEATAPSRDRRPPSCPRLSRLPLALFTRVKDLPAVLAALGSPCTGALPQWTVPPAPLHHNPESQGPQRLLSGLRGVTGSRRGNTALKNRGRRASRSSCLGSPTHTLTPPHPRAWRSDLRGPPGMPQGLQNSGRPGARARPTTWPTGASAPFFFFLSSSPTLLTLK